MVTRTYFNDPLPTTKQLQSNYCSNSKISCSPKIRSNYQKFNQGNGSFDDFELGIEENESSVYGMYAHTLTFNDLPSENLIEELTIKFNQLFGNQCSEIRIENVESESMASGVSEILVAENCNIPGEDEIYEGIFMFFVKDSTVVDVFKHGIKTWNQLDEKIASTEISWKEVFASIEIVEPYIDQDIDVSINSVSNIDNDLNHKGVHWRAVINIDPTTDTNFQIESDLDSP